MKKFGVVLLLMWVGRMTGELPPPERTYKLLMLLPVSSKSHRNVFMPLVEALADRGHKIVMFSCVEVEQKNPNIREMTLKLPYFPETTRDMFEVRKGAGSGLSVFKKRLPPIARDIYHIPEVKELYEKRKEFDLIVIDHIFNELIYPFAHEMPFITIATPGMDSRQSAVLGNPISTAYLPSLVGLFDLSSVYGRLLNTIAQIWTAVYWRNWAVVPAVQREIDMIFPDLPPLLEIERNQSLTLMNSHFSIDSVLPLLPSQVEVGGMHCHQAKPLPEALKSWIDGAGSAGVIYFSLGSIAKGSTIPVQYLQMFIEAFKKLDQRVIWKFEAELEGISKNVMTSQWLPQQDLLAHPNVKVFITHGGGLSIQEASYHGTPLLVLPIFADQPRNGANVVTKGLGLSLVWEELTVYTIVESLREIINNPRYSENIASVSRLLKDQINSPVDRAVFWTEYVIRHNGAPKLRSPATGLSWVEFLLLDVLALFLFILAVILLALRWILQKILPAILNWIFQKILLGIFSTSDKRKKQQ